MACSKPPPVCYYRQTFDWQRLLSILRPIKGNGELDVGMQLLDLETDVYSVDKHYHVIAESFVLVEGVFLFQPELLPYLDLKIFLQISQEECLRRVAQRDGYLFGDAESIRDRYLTKYLPGEAIYLNECGPEVLADLLINNESPASPVVIKPFVIG